ADQAQGRARRQIFASGGENAVENAAAAASSRFEAQAAKRGRRLLAGDVQAAEGVRIHPEGDVRATPRLIRGQHRHALRIVAPGYRWIAPWAPPGDVVD